MSDNERYVALVDDLRSLPHEVAWVEFKLNMADAERIGKLCSAMANSARLEDQDFAYVVWGIEDATHAVRGTTYNPDAETGLSDVASWQIDARRPLSISGD